MRTEVDRAFKSEQFDRKALEDVRFEGCAFDNCSARRSIFRRVEFVKTRVRACSLHNCTLEDSVVDGLRVRLEGGGGRNTPLFLWGVLAKRVTLRGRFGSVIWNPPRSDFGRAVDARVIEAAKNYYSTVDWAIDLTEATFTSVPSFRFGPPGSLIRRNPETQALVRRGRLSASRWHEFAGQIGIWRVVLDSFLERAWPDEIVLTPSVGQSAAKERAGIAMLRKAGVAE